MTDRRAAAPPTTGDPPSTVVDGVTVLRWPAEAELRPARAQDRLPRVLVIADDASPPAPPAPPVLDADGIVRGPGGWASVPPIEARLLAALLDRTDHVVHRADLHRAAWPGGNVNDRALDGRIKLLRRRVAPLGIAIRTVRGLGFLLEVDRG